MERFDGIFGDKNLSSTMRVGLSILSLFVDIRLKAMTGTQQFRPSLNSSSGKRLSNLIIPLEKLKWKECMPISCVRRVGVNQDMS